MTRINGRWSGSRVRRVEDARLLTGRGLFVDDVSLPGMLHACFVRSPFPRASIRAVDSAAAERVPGVRHVFTALDLNGDVHEQWHRDQGPDAPDTPRPPLAEGEVRFVGDPVAVVLADTRSLAEDACELVEIDYDPLAAVLDYTLAEAANELVQPAHGSNLIGSLANMPASAVVHLSEGATHVVTAEVHQQAYTAVPMEGRGIVVDFARSTGEYTIYAATQAPHEVRSMCSRLLALPEHRIRVIMRDTGGAFGQKVLVQREEMVLMLVGQKVGVPVKWVEDRRENLMAAGQSRHEQAAVTMAFDTDARIQAAHIDYLADCGAYPTPWPMTSSPPLVGILFPGPYKVPKAAFSVKAVYTNTVGRTAYRGPWQFESLAREVLLDIAARRMGVDPVEVRRRNLLSARDLPYTSANGMTYDAVTPLETLERALELLDYDAFRREQASARRQGRYLGVGVSTYIEPTTSGGGYFGTEAATIRIEPSGHVNVYIAGGSAGNSIETTVVQLTADALGVDLDDVSTIQGDTALTGFSAGTAGSRSAGMTAGAIRETAGILRARIADLAAHVLEASADDIEVREGWASVRGTPSVRISMRELARTAYFAPPPGMPAGLEATARYRGDRPFIWVNAAHVCTCEIDVETGLVTLLRYIVSEDCGPMINPNVVEGQIAGGTVQGIGGVLLEHLAYDEGNPVATTLMDYLVPTACDVPMIEYLHVETPSAAVSGHKGVGEGGAIGAPPAVVNAVNDALAPLGVELTHLPLTPSRILEAIRRAS
ncbi:MAG: xanthine dehydrogenase family protein molybdopterin-binding subunit [Acidimicrobiia bacterium]